MSLKYERTAEDAQHVVKLAKMKMEELQPATQVFYMPSQDQAEFAKKHIKIMDVDEEFITKLEEGERFVFRGSDSEKLVMCSENETFDVKEAEISNALVLVPQLLYSNYPHHHTAHHLTVKPIIAIKHSYLELRPTFPKLRKLRDVLANAVYKGPDEQENGDKGVYFCDLLDSVQSSKEQLLTALEEIPAVRIDNRWRILDVEYESSVLSQIINLTEENPFCGKLIKSQVCQALHTTIPSSILEHIFHHFTRPAPPDQDDAREWNAYKVCRSFAEMLLRAGQGKFRYNDFIMAWSQCLPKGIEADLSTLRGLAIIEEQTMTQNVIHLFPEYDLPENVAERFRILFKRKPKWTLQQIEPYIEKMATSAMNVSTMLTRYSRASTERGVRVFGARLK